LCNLLTQKEERGNQPIRWRKPAAEQLVQLTMLILEMAYWPDHLALGMPMLQSFYCPLAPTQIRLMVAWDLTSDLLSFFPLLRIICHPLLRYAFIIIFFVLILKDYTVILLSSVNNNACKQ
jgi:hypothetical protein